MDFYGKKDASKLPPHIFKDGVKWLMVPSKIILDSLSVWPDRQNRITNILSGMLIVSYVYLIIGQIAFILDKDTDLATAADATSGIVVAVETVGRRILCMLLAKRTSKILSTIYYDFWPSDIGGKELHRTLTRASWILLVVCFSYISIAVIWGIQCLTQPLVSHILPLSSKFPFNYMQSPFYEMLYIWEGVLSVELAFNICGNDFFFVSLMWNCVVQFRLLRAFLLKKFEEAVKRADVTPEKGRAEAMDLILVCFRRHNNLIRICKELEEMLTVFILMLYLGTVGTVCLSSFLLTVVRKEIGRPLTYFAGHMSQIFLYCFMGNELIIESSALADAVYQCGWHLAPYDRNLRKSLVLIMVRSQRPITITMGGFGVLSLTSYMKLLQFCFSVYTLLSKMMRNQDPI